MEDVAAALPVPAGGPRPVQAGPGVLLEVVEDGRGLEPGRVVGALQKQQLIGASDKSLIKFRVDLV